ncbi:MAG: hypothetical protein D6801_03075, partial [Alphaproteobacteria bacterium]
MDKPREPMFLERESYRRRRLVDAMRLLPVVGMIFFLIPLLGASGTAPRPTAQGAIYVFSVWLGLIVAAALFARLLAGGGGRGGAT